MFELSVNDIGTALDFEIICYFDVSWYRQMVLLDGGNLGCEKLMFELRP
jgi:hypothetical protein